MGQEIIVRFEVVTAAQYAAIPVKAPTTLYIVVG